MLSLSMENAWHCRGIRYDFCQFITIADENSLSEQQPRQQNPGGNSFETLRTHWQQVCVDIS